MTHHQGAAETAAPHLAADPHLLTALRAGGFAGVACVYCPLLPIILPPFVILRMVVHRKIAGTVASLTRGRRQLDVVSRWHRGI